MKSIILKPKREKNLLRRHPWIFSGAVAEVRGQPQPGETVEILSANGTWCGRGAYSPRSQIAVRLWTFAPDEAIDDAFFRSRLARALTARQAQMNTDGPLAVCRLVNAEADGLPGLIVDRYADFLVCQIQATGPEYWREAIVRGLRELLPAFSIYERSDARVRDKEGLPARVGILAGREPDDLIEITEGRCRFLVDIKTGHKTGFYLDQRPNRAMASEYATGNAVLNCFAYTGGFAVACAMAGAAEITNIETSAAALDLCRRNLELNGIDHARIDNVEGDVFVVLRQYRDAGRQFDLIILDPPKFAESRHQLERASRGYKDINLLAFKLLRPGGILFTFSCSGLLDRDLFQKIVAGAALDAGRDAQIVRWLTQGPDHPSALHFPEGGYLKGLACRVWE